MAQQLLLLICSFTLLSAVLLASIVDSRPLLSSQSRASRPNRRMSSYFPSAINMTSRENVDGMQSFNTERVSNGINSAQHLKVAHSWLAGEGRRDLLGVDLTQSQSQAKDPAQAQADLASAPQVTAIPSSSSSISDLVDSLGLSSTGWDWQFPSPLQSTIPLSSGVGLQSNLLLSEIPNLQDSSTSNETGSDLGQDLAPAVIGRVVPSKPALTPQEIEKLEIERLNEQELDNGYGSFFNNSAIFSRSKSDSSSKKDSKPSSSTPNSALPTTQTGKYASDWLSSALNLYERRVLVGADNLNFVDSPTKAVDDSTSTTSSGSVLSVFYPNNSYSPSHSDPVGGVSFYAQPFSISPDSDAADSSSSTSNDSNSSSPRVFLPALTSLPIGASNLLSSTSNTSSEFSTSRPSLLLSYSVYFPPDFDFVKGGKLPGLYSSTGSINASTGLIDANTDSCSGGAGDEAGQSCWSVRLMWRANGEGEAYLYLPIGRSGQYDPCGNSESGNDGKPRENWICNNDYGVSLGRGKFSFVKGGWTEVSLFVQLNSAPTLANGQISVWSNGNQVIEEKNMLFRTGSKVATKTGKGGGSGDNASKRNVQQPFAASTTQVEGQWVDKVFFSSFFGGATSDFAATSDTYSYFKDVSLHAGTSPSNLSGLDLTHSSEGHSSAGLRLSQFSLVSFVTFFSLIYSLL